MKKLVLFLLLILLVGCSTIDESNSKDDSHRSKIIELVYLHAHAWKAGDLDLLDQVLHEDVIFAYPGRRLNKEQTIEDLDYFRKHFTDVNVYITEIIIDGDNVAIEWQFASTKTKTGKRQVVSDGIIAKVKDGKFIVWKEYLDGRVKYLQASGELFLEEGQEPFPWPQKTELYGKT